MRLRTPDAIESFETVTLSGVQQSMLIRGQHRNNPVILYLHGGPGTPMYSWYRVIGVDTRLEEHFVVVYWEQRGVNGRRAGITTDSLRIADFVADGCQLASMLKQRFGARPALLGISWGSFLGVRMLAACGASISAYVGSGQIVDFTKADEHAVAYIRSEAAKAADQDAVKAVDRLGSPPWSFDRITSVTPLLAKYGAAAAHTPQGKARLPGRPALLEAPEYSLLDLIWGARNSTFLVRNMWDELHRSNLDDINSVSVPLFLLEGDYDRITAPSLARSFFDRVEAPRKEWISFSNSAHVVPADEPLAFGKAVFRVLGGR